MSILNQELKDFINAAYPIIYIHTEATALASQAVIDFANKDRVDIFDMSTDDDLKSFLLGYINNSKSLDGVFIIIEESHSLLNDAKVVAQLRQIGQRIFYEDHVDARIIIISPLFELAQELEKMTAVFSDEALSHQARQNFIRRLAFAYQETLSSTDLDLLTNTLESCSLDEMNMIINMLIQKHGSLERLDYEAETANIKKHFASQML